MLNNQKPSIPLLIEDLEMQYPTETSKHKTRFGLYRCQCGKEFRAITQSVKRGNTSSCGCFNKQRSLESNTTHGLKHHQLYGVLRGIIGRTTNPKQKYFKNYGNRGITICDEWINNPQSFFDWCYANGYEKSLEIDRKDNDKGYSPDNCRFVTRSVNMRNTRKIRVNNTSGYRGVHFHKSNNKWVARIGFDGNKKHLGYYSTAIEAAKAYDRYVIENGLEHTKNF